MGIKDNISQNKTSKKFALESNNRNSIDIYKST